MRVTTQADPSALDAVWLAGVGTDVVVGWAAKQTCYEESQILSKFGALTVLFSRTRRGGTPGLTFLSAGWWPSVKAPAAS